MERALAEETLKNTAHWSLWIWDSEGYCLCSFFQFLGSIILCESKEDLENSCIILQEASNIINTFSSTEISRVKDNWSITIIDNDQNIYYTVFQNILFNVFPFPETAEKISEKLSICLEKLLNYPENGIIDLSSLY